MIKKVHSSKAIHRHSKPLKMLIFSRFLIVILLLLIQAAFVSYIYFAHFPFTKTVTLVAGGIGILVSSFIINTPEKNEFKLAWIIPILVMPVFGILLYIFFKTNIGGYRLKKSLHHIKTVSSHFLYDEESTGISLSKYPKVRDISTYLKQAGGFSAYTNTKTKYFTSGEDFFPVMLKDLEKAQKFIFVEYFVIEEGEMWSQMLSVLTKKAAEGVKVFILYDSLGSVSLATREYQFYLKKIGLNAKVFSPFIPLYDTALNNRDHRKLIDIDDKIAYTGGLNISDEYINRIHPRFNYWKDNAIRIEGKAVRTFTVTFLQLWYLQNRKTNLTNSDFESFFSEPDTPIEAGGIVIPYSDDAYSNQDIAGNVYNYILAKSHNYVHIMTPYLIIDNTMMNALIFAAKRGVEVSIIVPAKYDHFMTFCVGRRFIKQLIQNSVHVYSYTPGFVHSKIFVSDDNRATVGSINLDYRSLYHHFECGNYIYYSPVIAEIEKDFQETKKQCEEITADSLKKIPLVQKLTGWFLKIFSPLL